MHHDSKKQESRPRKNNFNTTTFIGIGAEILVLIVLAGGIGQYLDKKWNLKGLATAFLVILALVIWLFHLIVLLRQFEKDKKELR